MRAAAGVWCPRRHDLTQQLSKEVAVPINSNSTNPSRMTRKTRFNRGLGWRRAVLRQLARLEQGEAAAKAGIPLATWRELEAGRGCKDPLILGKIADAFGR